MQMTHCSLYLHTKPSFLPPTLPPTTMKLTTNVLKTQHQQIRSYRSSTRVRFPSETSSSYRTPSSRKISWNTNSSCVMFCLTSPARPKLGCWISRTIQHHYELLQHYCVRLCSLHRHQSCVCLRQIFQGLYRNMNEVQTAQYNDSNSRINVLRCDFRLWIFVTISEWTIFQTNNCYCSSK